MALCIKELVKLYRLWEFPVQSLGLVMLKSHILQVSGRNRQMEQSAKRLLNISRYEISSKYRKQKEDNPPGASTVLKNRRKIRRRWYEYEWDRNRYIQRCGWQKKKSFLFFFFYDTKTIFQAKHFIQSTGALKAYWRFDFKGKIRSVEIS